MCKSGWHTDKRFLTIRLVCQWNYFPFGVVSSLPLEWFKLRLPRLLQVKSQNSPPRNVSYLKTGLYFLQFWNWCFPVPGPEPIFNKSSAGKCTDGWIHWERKCARWSPKAPVTLRLSDFISSQCPLKGPNKASHPHCKDGKNSPCKVAASRALRPPAWAAAYLSWSPKNRQSPVSFLESEDEGCSHQRSRHWKTLCAPGRLSWGACWKQTSEPTSGVLTQQAWARPRGRPLNEPCGPICCFGPLSDPTVRNPVLGSSDTHKSLGSRVQQVWWHHSWEDPHQTISQRACPWCQNSTVKRERLWNGEMGSIVSEQLHHVNEVMSPT